MDPMRSRSEKLVAIGIQQYGRLELGESESVRCIRQSRVYLDSLNQTPSQSRELISPLRID